MALPFPPVDVVHHAAGFGFVAEGLHCSRKGRAQVLALSLTTRASFIVFRTAPGEMNSRSAICRTVRRPDSISFSHFKLRSSLEGAPTNLFVLFMLRFESKIEKRLHGMRSGRSLYSPRQRAGLLERPAATPPSWQKG